MVGQINFMVGDRVVEINLGHTGEITNGFFWRSAEGKPPQTGQVPVQWDNGEPTYVYAQVLDYE